MDPEGSRLFFQLMPRRYEKGWTIFSSNKKSYGERGGVIRDNVIAYAILDRILQHSTTLNIRGGRATG